MQIVGFMLPLIGIILVLLLGAILWRVASDGRDMRMAKFKAEREASESIRSQPLY